MIVSECLMCLIYIVDF